MWIYWFIGLFVIIHFENVLSQSENSRKQHFLRNDEQQQEIPPEYLSFLQELSHYQGAKQQTLSQVVPQKNKNHQQHIATLSQGVPQKSKNHQQHIAMLSQGVPQKNKNQQQHIATLSQAVPQINKNYQQLAAKIQYEYEPKQDKQIRYVTEKEYAQLIESEQESKPLLKKQQQIHQQNRFKQQQTRFNQNLRQRDQLDQDLLQSSKQVTSPFDGSSFEKELKRLESLNRPINNQDFNSKAQQSGYNTRQDEEYKDDAEPSSDNIKTTKAQNESKRNAGKQHRELENSRLPFLDKDRVFSQNEFQAFLDAGYPVVAVPVVQEVSSRPNY